MHRVERVSQPCALSAHDAWVGAADGGREGYIVGISVPKTKASSPVKVGIEVGRMSTSSSSMGAVALFVGTAVGAILWQLLLAKSSFTNPGRHWHSKDSS
jgi:hypothetical protein